MARPHPLLSPPLTPFTRERAARALGQARVGYRMTRQYAAQGRPDLAAWCITHADYLRATGRAIRAGALHDTARRGWPYLIPQPQIPPVPDDTHLPFPV